MSRPLGTTSFGVEQEIDEERLLLPAANWDRPPVVDDL